MTKTYLTINYQTQNISLLDKNRKITEVFPPEAFDASMSVDTWVKTLTFSSDYFDIELETVFGDLIKIDINDFSEQPQKPFIYLDQNHWSNISKTLRHPEKLSSPELTAYTKIIELVQDDKIILPFSDCHLLETTQNSSDIYRREIATDILKYSNGWQMLHPTYIRKYELQQTIFTEIGRLNEQNSKPVIAFSQLPYWFNPDFTKNDNLQGIINEGDFLIASIRDYSELFLSKIPIERTFPDEWVKNNNDFSEFLKGYPKHKRPEAIKLYVQTDARKEIAYAIYMVEQVIQTGIMPLTNDDKMKFIEKIFSKMLNNPLFDTFSTVYLKKFQNVGNKWENNDLNDIYFLSAAYAYADYVLAEKKFTNFLNNKSSSHNTIFHKPMDLVTQLELQSL